MLEKNHIYKKKVCGFHCDVYGHVNNARYLEFFEEARWNLLDPIKSTGILEEKKWWTIVVHIELSYKTPLHLNDEIEIHSSISEFGKKSVTFEQKIYKANNQHPTTIAKVKFVVFDTVAKKALIINDEIKQIFGVN